MSVYEDAMNTVPMEIPPETLSSALAANLAPYLGGHFLLVRRESWSPSYEDAPQWDEDPLPPGWTASCRCTACGGHFRAGWSHKKNRPVELLLYVGEDGVVYEGVPDGKMAEGGIGHIARFGDGATGFICPLCGKPLTVAQKSQFRHPKTWRLIVGAVRNAGPYTALVFWMLFRSIDANARVTVRTFPECAVLLNEKRKLIPFSPDGSRWSRRVRVRDPFQKRYASSGTLPRVGGWMDAVHIPEQRGQSGEKTALTEYLRDDGSFPILFLCLWSLRPAVENLVKSGWTATVEDALITDIVDAQNRGKTCSTLTTPLALFNWTCASPVKMLCMTRPEVREFAAEHWPSKKLRLWFCLCDTGLAGPGYARDFAELYERYGYQPLVDWSGYVADGGDAPFPKLDRYLTKQARRRGADMPDMMRMFLDYRSMLPGGQALTEIELWPPNLPAAHDRLAASVAAAKREQQNGTFTLVREKWIGLEWSDGDLCARLPRSHDDLTAEGHALRHCVGGYGQSHISGKLIIFIRHARRPERSYFTLNVDTTRAEPEEIQLHGYGNEWAHGRRLHIPKKVRAFCDRWETEVLAPVFRRVRALEK